MRSLLPAFFFLLIYLPVSGQYYSTGQDPASVKWRQITTDRYRLIFPDSFETKAQYLANILDVVCRNETTTLHARVPRLPVILHTQSVLSNGVTVWAPRRIEMYSCPPQGTYAEEWLEQLAIHEYRHAVQISSINRGFSRALYYIFGEQITGGILGLYVPAWFLEGDATVTETAMTNTGRGRSALFGSILRAQVVEKGIYSYDKATLGSYKTYVPDAYQLGYHLVGKARVKYGPELWNTAMDRVAKYPFMVVPFNSGIRKVTGMWKVNFYKQTMGDLDSAWQSELSNIEPFSTRMITRRNPKNHADYFHPMFLNDSTIIADKSCMDDLDRFVLIDRRTGEERIILTPGHHQGGTTSISGDYLAWSELEYDKRWSNRDYSEIRLYDFRTGKHFELADESRYFSPILSPDASRLAAVFVTEENRCFIDILRVPTGELLRQFPIPEGCQAIMPAWSPDMDKIIFTLLTAHGETIATLDMASGRIARIFPPSFDEFTGPASFFGNYIIFSVDWSGRENIYAMDTVKRKAYRISSGRFSTFDPDFTADKKWMVCSEYTSDGLMVSEMAIDTSAWIPVVAGDTVPPALAAILSKQEPANIQDSILHRNIYKMNASDQFDLVRDTIQGVKYPVSNYSKFLSLFNPHSWAPLSFDIGNLDVKPGVMLLSQNALSSMFAGMGWEYDLNERTGKFYTSLSYRGWYPVIDFRFDIGNRASYARYHGSSDTYRFTWQETNLKVAVSVPFNLSHLRFTRLLNPFAGITLIGISHHESTPESFTEGWIQTMNYGITFSQYLSSNQKDVYPRLGQSVDLLFRNSPFGSNDMGSIFGAEANLYFPGIFRHQGIWIYGGYQRRREADQLSYTYADIISYPRGYSDSYDEELISLKANYKLPLWYPDASLGSLIYLKRLKMNLFYDWANGKNPGYINEYQSAGCELTADFHLLRFVAPVEMGVRSIYYPIDGTWGFQFLYAISY